MIHKHCTTQPCCLVGCAQMWRASILCLETVNMRVQTKEMMMAMLDAWIGSERPERLEKILPYLE